MRKRSVQEIIEVTTAGGTPITSGDDDDRKKRIQQTASAAEKKIADERNKAQKAKPSIDQQKINLAKYQSRTDRIKANTKKQQAIDKAEADKKQQRSAEKETQSSTVTSRENLRKTIAGGKPNIQKTKGGNKSISDTGTVASNAIKRAASLGRNVAAIPANIAKQKAKARLGRMQMADGEAPDKGTARQKIGYATKKSRERVNTAVTNTRRKVGRGIETVGRKLANEDYIHEAEKDSSEKVKKKTIDVMKGKNAVEVNPKIQAEETMSPAQKRKDTNLKKKYDDSDMKQNMIDQYGEEEGEKVYYATIRKQAMKTEAKIDQTMTPAEKRSARNERQMKKDAPFRSLSKNYVSKLNQKYRREFIHEPKRGVKKVKGNMTLKDRVGEMRGMSRPNRLARIAQHAKKIDVTDVKKYKDGSYGGTTEYSHYEPKGPVVMESGLEVQNVSDGLKFREYEFIDVIKNEPMKSPKNNITWTEEVGPDGEGLTPSQQRKGLGMSGSGIRKLKKKMQDKGNFDVETNLKKKTPDEKHTTTTSEAKMPVQGLVKLAAMVADNNKKRKNALQIQKVIGEDAKTGRMSDDDLAAAHKKISGMDQSMPSNQHMLKRINKEINKRKKVNEEIIVEKQGGNKKKPDTKINYRTAFTQDRALNSTPDEERAAAKRMSIAQRIRQQKRDEIDRKKAKKNENRV